MVVAYAAHVAAGQHDKPISHRTTSALMITGFTLVALSLLGRSMTAETSSAQFSLALATFIVAWIGAVFILRHRRWVRSLDDRQHHR